MRYFEKQRIEFIGQFIAEHGHINRADIMDKFDISLPQASKDIQKFIKLNPDVIEYDLKARKYRNIK